MTECESVRGTWGLPCPDCGVTLPPSPKPLKSWMAERHVSEVIGDRARVSRKPHAVFRLRPERRWRAA